MHLMCCSFLYFPSVGHHFCTYFHVFLFPLYVDPAGTLCHKALDPPRGSIKKPLCEVNPFLPHPSTLKWVAPLTDSSRSPIYLEADWLSSMHQGVNKQLKVSSIMRAPTASKEHNGNDWYHLNVNGPTGNIMTFIL